MCTVSWLVRPGVGEVVFSRDEQRTRALAAPPEPRTIAGTPLLAPLDPVGGGTWIFVNAHGFVACLLNHYDARPSAAPAGAVPPVSRGRLLLALAAEAAVAGVEPRLRVALAGARYLPCHVLAFDRRGVGARWTWDGARLEAGALPECGLVSTSSFDGPRVVAARAAAFAAWRQAHPETAGAGLWEFHLAAGVRADAVSVRMSRPDARTVSLARVTVDGARLALAYAAREGDGGFAPASTHRLEPALVSPA